MVLFILIVATDAFTSLGTTSPLYIKQQAMYLPCLGSHFTIIFAGSNADDVISGTVNYSWYAFSADIIGAYDESIKWILGYGTKLV